MSLEDKIEIIKGDITEIEAEAVVNAANTELVLGSGVAGAIRNKGGPSIQLECDEIGPIELGEAAVTGAGNLEARFVIHAAGMRPGGSVDKSSLENATRNSLLRAGDNGVKSIAFPAIGTGVGGFPALECAEIMIDVVCEYLIKYPKFLKKVYFVLFDDRSYEIFKEALNKKMDAL